MQFRITINHDRRNYRLVVDQLPSDASFDYYRVRGRNKAVTFRNNAPVLRRHNLKHRRPEWKVVEGDIWNDTFKEKIIEQLDRVISSTK